MSSNIVMHPEQPVKPKNFVSAHVEEPTERDQYRYGRSLYYRGKPLAACLTDEQSRGWLAAEAKCESQYWGSMVAQASAQEMN